MNKNFDTRLVNLVTYKERYGDTNVPYHYPDQLGVWVHSTHTEVRKFCKGIQPCSMSHGQLARLIAVGFHFETPRNFHGTA